MPKENATQKVSVSFLSLTYDYWPLTMVNYCLSKGSFGPPNDFNISMLEIDFPTHNGFLFLDFNYLYQLSFDQLYLQPILLLALLFTRS